MKNRIAVVLSVFAAWSLLATAGHAELLLYEPFDYEIGDIDNQNGGEGFGGPWAESPDQGNLGFIQVVQPDQPLSYVVPGGGVISGGSTALQFANETADVLADDQTILLRDLASPVDADEVYISFLYRYADGFIEDNDFVVWYYYDTEGFLQPHHGPAIGLKGNGGNGSQPEDLIARVGNWYASPQQEYAPGVDITEEEGTIGVDFFIVGRLSKAENSDEPDLYDQYDLWVNPGANDQDDPDATAMGLPENFDGLITAFTTLGMRTFNQEPGDTMLWDELRLGTTWDDVIRPEGGVAPLRAGDANMDYEFDQADLVQVQIAAKYLTGQAATWGEGDWECAPGGSPDDPPVCDGVFGQLDIIAALAAGTWLQGPYNAISHAGVGMGDADSIYTPVPEPSTIVLLACALLGLAGRLYERRRR